MRKNLQLGISDRDFLSISREVDRAINHRPLLVRLVTKFRSTQFSIYVGGQFQACGQHIGMIVVQDGLCSRRMVERDVVIKTTRHEWLQRDIASFLVIEDEQWIDDGCQRIGCWQSEKVTFQRFQNFNNKMIYQSIPLLKTKINIGEASFQKMQGVCTKTFFGVDKIDKLV